MSGYRAAIRNIPHTRAGLAAIEKLRVPGMRNWARGRGAYRGHDEAHDLCKERATKFTLYQFRPFTWEQGYQYADYIRTETNGKIRLRIQA